MASTEDNILRQVAEATEDAELGSEVVDQGIREPIYKVIGETRIPVSKHAGSLWRSRKTQAVKKMEERGLLDNWDEAIRYYKNDQRTGMVKKGDRSFRRPNRINSTADQETENIVWANTSALVPSLYAKNPACEITVHDTKNEEMKQIGDKLQKLVNIIISKKTSPGINLKPKARKSVVMTTLTNISYIEIGYTFKEEGSEEALQELDRISQQLTDAKSANDIEQLEGQLEALEEKINFLRPSGPWAKFRHPKDVIRDPDSTEADLSDAKWIMIGDYVSTQWLNAVYRKKSGEGEYVSIYKPTHIIAEAGNNELEDQINTFSIIESSSNDWRKHGYKDEESYRSAQRTKVWYVWDKITRRVFMYNDQDWSWPIWVWADRYNLDQFFPLYALEFYTDPEDDIAQSEVMYYLDQQDALNDCHKWMAIARKWVRSNLFYNADTIKDKAIVEKFLKGGSEDTAYGVKGLAPDQKLQDQFFTAPPPGANFIQLFDTRPIKEAASGLSSVDAVMRGEQFKTNTTNEAIETYNSQSQTRLDEKIDAVEDFIGNIAWGVCQMVLQFMTPEEVGNMIGDQDAQVWRNMDKDEIASNFSATVVGGSTQKPTSKAKKQEAQQVGQILGQFANAGNGAAILILLKLFQKAYDDFTIEADDWQMLIDSIQQQTQGGAGAQGASGEDILNQVVEFIGQFPPQAVAALGKAMAQGVPIQEALPAIMEMLQSPGTETVQ